MATFASPFVQSELIGFFRWDSGLSKSLSLLGTKFYHACHKSIVRSSHLADQVWLRSIFNASVADDEIETIECVWASLQPWHRKRGHNHFGPFTIKIPMSRLDGRRFYVFKRRLNLWKHYYFVQRETTKPLFPGHPAKECDPRGFFLKTTDGLDEKSYVQYQLALTEPVPLRGARIIATDHNGCASRDCSGLSKEDGIQIIRDFTSRDVEKLAERFPQVRGKLLAAITELATV